jgi:hypothetical protein
MIGLSKINMQAARDSFVFDNSFFCLFRIALLANMFCEFFQALGIVTDSESLSGQGFVPEI